MRVTLTWSQAGLLLQNVWDVLPGVLSAADVCTTFRDEYWTGNVKARTSSDCTLDTISASDGPVPFTLNVADAGARSGPTLPPNCTLLVTKIPTGAGRIGRTFHPGIIEADVDDGGRIEGAAMSAFVGAFAGARIDMAAAGVELGVRNHTPGGPAGDYTTFGLTGLIPGTRIGALKQRLR